MQMRVFHVRCELAWVWSLLLVTLAALPGCASGGGTLPADQELRALAVRYIELGMKYPDNPTVRASAVEAAAEVFDADVAIPDLRTALKDEHPGVRFAACMALGNLRDKGSLEACRRLAHDPDPSVRVGAYYALERLGDHNFRPQWRDALRKSENAAVRRNAALAMGQLRSNSVKALLAASANDDPDEGVRLQASEGLALLGDADAITSFIRDSYGGVGYKQPFGLLVLGKVSDDRAVPVLKRGLSSSPYHEAKLAAARALGRHGRDDGFSLAVQSLDWNKPKKGLADDPPDLQIMRVRQMAALALGAIGQRRGLEPLVRQLKTEDDPRVQIASATAILTILNKVEKRESRKG